MTSEMVPPPSLSSMPSYDEPEDRTTSRQVDPMVPVAMTYDDEFAPSSATLSIDDPTQLKTKGARLMMYNKHLMGEGQRTGSLKQVMLEAEELGCPRFPPPMPLVWMEISEEDCHRAATSCAVLVQDVEEHSEEWLILNCYMNAVFATEAANKGVSSAMVGGYMFLLGATLRELELVRRNKKDALDRRRSSRILGNNNEGRREFNELRGREAQKWQRLALGLAIETKLTGTARAKWIATQLDRRHGIQRAHKTIAKFLTR